MSASHKLEVFAARLEGVRWSNGTFRANCPVHGGRGALSARDTDDGRVLFRCYALCAPIEILQAVNLDWQAMMPDRLPGDRHRFAGAAPDYRAALLGLEHEARVLHVCAEDMLRGKVSEALVARVAEAANRIHAVTEVEMKGRRRRAA